MTDKTDRAAHVVRQAIDGNLGPEARDLAALFAEGARRGREETARADRFEREANALAAVVADLMDGAQINETVDDLPHDARRRVIAYRHKSGPVNWAHPMDQFGPLPTVPPRASVMRDRIRVVDQEPEPYRRPRSDDAEPLIIEGVVVASDDEQR